jgi:hypothetical protein
LSVVGIRPGQAISDLREPNAGAIKVLEDLLERARAGELVGVAVVAYQPGGETWWQIAGIHGRGTIGALEVVKADLVGRDLRDEV